MSNEINILTIDLKIRNNFTSEIEKLDLYKSRLQDINKSLEIENIKDRVKNRLLKSKTQLESHIHDIETKSSLNFYITESAELLEKYKEILNEPLKMNFLGKKVKNNKDKQRIFNEYLEIASKYVSIDLENKEIKDKIICKNCNNKKDFDIIDGNIYVCINCSAQQIIMKNVSSYKDIDRVNITSKYLYDRKIHFRDCINQYQGKQNSTISQKVYDDLEKQFELHHLLKGDKETSKNIRFANITKEHIGIFLKELQYTKHYENINLIYYNITGKKPDDIGYLEEKLLEDFDILTDVYDKKFKNIDRKNFINTQYVLYQLLLRHKHVCNKEDFSILKTIDRKNFHDEIMKVLFEAIGWNFSPFY
jgi:hypothetical protein